MVMKNKLKFIMIILFSMHGKMMNAQDGSTANHSISYTIPSVSMVDVEGGASINLGLTSPSEAGQGMGISGTNSSLWLNYSSTTNTASTNTVKVKVDALLPGIDLKIIAASDAAGGAGAPGSPSSILTLTTSDQNLINNIGTCYTGDGTSKGHNITYSMVANSYNQIKYTSVPSPVTITFTITNN